MLIRTVTALFLSVPYLPPAPAEPVSTIDAVVEAYREAARIPGIAVAVVQGDRIVHAAGYGQDAAGEPVTARTVLPIASLSKSVTARAVMELVEAGRVRLDEPVREQLPEFTMADDRAATITVRQLLDHTSGMSDQTYQSFSGPPLHSLREAVASMRDARLAADPGSRFEYHNPNYQVAARLVEVASGQSFDAYLREHVFGPLGMTDSRTIGTPDELDPPGPGHRMIAGLAVALPEPPSFGNGSGGVLSTATDMAAWLIAQQRWPRPTGSYSLGWNAGTTQSGAPLIDHTGGLVTITAYQALLPAQGYGIAIMANAGSQYGDAPDLGDRLIALLEGREVPAPPGSGSAILLDAGVLLAGAVPMIMVARRIRRPGARGWLRTPRWLPTTGWLPIRGWGARFQTRGWLRVRAWLRLLPHLVPILLLAMLDRVVSVLYRGMDISWVQAIYLFPSFTVLLVVTALASAVALGAGLRAMRAGRSHRQGSAATPAALGTEQS
ncbi:serine hydrolase domain-containing protein [Actinoplanes sp. G11-F43]|uniref:serine hydrolase domain-containing protein n=1 Tax=Actinoplanes sp. G11-F43 TaxID=3424130 RepID=UPI003D32F46D